MGENKISDMEEMLAIISECREKRPRLKYVKDNMEDRDHPIYTTNGIGKVARYLRNKLSLKLTN